jgi:hypothetical protein
VPGNSIASCIALLQRVIVIPFIAHDETRPHHHRAVTADCRARAAEAEADRTATSAGDRRRLSQRLPAIGRRLRARPEHELPRVPEGRRDLPGRLHDVVQFLRRDGMPVALSLLACRSTSTSSMWAKATKRDAEHEKSSVAKEHNRCRSEHDGHPSSRAFLPTEALMEIFG